MPVSTSTSQVNTIVGDCTATKACYQGIIDLYANFAKSHVQLYVKKGKVEEISRAKVELQLLNQIDKAELPFEYKLSWIHAVSLSNLPLPLPYAFFC